MLSPAKPISPSGGIIYAAYEAENDGYLPTLDDGPVGWDFARPGLHHEGESNVRDSTSYRAAEDLRFCPMATKRATGEFGSVAGNSFMGGTFLAWQLGIWEVRPWVASYGRNGWAYSWTRYQDSERAQRFWTTSSIKNAAAAPVCLDCRWIGAGVLSEKLPPPEFEDVPLAAIPENMDSLCINRHNGGINSLFLDWSVRKVGLKELWAIKWSRDFNTHGLWTKVGGVRPEDWPDWMSGFKDY